MEFSKKSEYFGIKEEYKNKKDLTLRFTVHRPLREKDGRVDEEYKKIELETIKELKPLTQNPESNSDNMLYIQTKIKIVEKIMIEKGFI